MLHKSLEAANRIAQESGAEIEVIDLRTLLPFDAETVAASVKKTNRLLIVHEASKTGGIAGEITARVSELAFEWLDAPPRRVTGPDTPVPYAPSLEEYYLVQVDDIVKASRWLLDY
jgi:pyruvate/2-oxoglutarate/acetoin dehydrogenase E1 component